MPMHTVGKGKNAVLTEDWLTTTPKRGFDYIFSESGLDAEEGREFVNNKLAEAQKNLDKVKNGKPKMGTSIAAYKEAKEAYTTRVEDAQKAVDYWQSVKAEHDKVLLAERHARDEKDKALHEQAVAEEQQRMQDDARKATEQAELGSNAVAPTIRDKWNAAKKENGDADEITLPNGEVVKGHYVLTESGAASASHQATNGFAETEGFPIDENGQSVNDRDYKRDQEAQQVTRSMATDYDQRALQSPVVVSQEGVVLSGNGRTMAGELAAQDGTDTKYVDYLHSHANKFGFTPEQVNGFKHPRVVFVPNEAMPYNADTFAKFNQREQKSQNNTEMAVKMGKVVNDALFGRIMDMVSKYDTLGEFYADDNATYAVVKQLAEADIIPQTEMAHLFDGGKLSEAGQSMIEGVMIGKVFQANPDAVRQITEVKSMRQAVMTALQDIVQNNRLGGGYNLSNELAEAVNLVYRARKAGYKLGQHVSYFAHQGNLFEYDEGATVADFNNMAVMMLADVLNDGRSTQLKKMIAFYNEQATDAAQGIGDMFVGGVKSKTEIINEVNKALNNGREYNTTATSLADGQGQRNQSSKQSNDVGTSGTDGKQTNDTSAVTAEANVESGATDGEKSSAKGDVVPSVNGDTQLSEKIATASAEVNTEPTEAQKEAGNYKKGHVQVGTFDITIEQPQGSVRKGTDADGKQWESKMNNTYGYIRGAVGVDGDHIDVFLSNDIDGWNGRKVFVVDQYNPDGSFDEHKVMLGFNDADEAKSDYLANYEKGWEDGRRIDVTAVNLEDFEKWIESSKRKTKPFGEYAGVKKETVAADEMGTQKYSALPEDLRQQKADGKSAQLPTREETILRDAVIDHMKESGLDMLGTEEGQQVLDMANGRDVRLSAKQKRALETASLGNNPRSLTVVSSADGAKVLKNVDELANKLDKSATQPKTFIGDVAKALGAKRLGSGSEYATFETKNGIVVTIRLANHNAHVSGFDYNGRDNGISIVISPKPNEKIKNDGNAHIIEYYYDSIKLRRAEGKPLAEIVRSIQQSLYSGDFKDTTGLAEREEVNEDMIREQRVYHGSGADFGHFDHSHMGEGEGAQAFGWGTYVTEVEGIGRTYAESTRKKPTYLYGGKEMSSDEFHDYVLGEIGDWNENMLNDFMYNLERHGVTRAKDILKKGDLARYKNLFYQSLGDTRNYAEGKIKAARTLLSLKGIRIRKPKSHLYTIEIPDDNGKNYLDWNGHPAESLLKDVGSFLESNGFERVQDSPARYEKGKSTVVLNPNATGADLYAELQEALGSDKKASQTLAELGYIGIKYPADNMRGGREDGAKNYVIFNENDAKITDHVRFFKTKNGEAYGFTIGGKIYIDPKVATSETPVHEYAHLWATALKANNAKEWQNVVGLMKGTSVWEEVKKLYPELKSDDEIADEVLATYSGRRGAERLRKEMDDIAKSNGNVFDKATAMNAMHRVKQAIEKFWKAVADFLHIHYTSAEQVADQVMKDLLDGVDPRSMMDGGKSLRPETRINIVAAKAEHGFKNYAEAKTWAKEHIARTYSGKETGGKGDIRISNAAVDKYLSQSAVDKSDSKDVHLSVLKVLPDVIRESVDAEQHADFKKGEDGVRSAENGINPNVTIHRLYGAVRMDGKVYRVKVTLKKNTRTKETPKAYSYEATKIELLEGSLSQTEGSHNLEPSNSKSEVSAGQHGNVSGLTSTFPRYSDKSITAANLLNGVEKSYGGGKFFEDYNKIREQFIGEQGAERADHAEEVTTRLDNLSVAREMENDKKDAKAIKLATGWERGADGKWRYEIPDLKYFSKGDAGYKKARGKQPWSKELDGLSDRIFDGEELSESEYQRFDELAQKEEKFKTDYLNREKPHLADWVENDKLFKAYPDLKRVKMVFTDQLPVNVGGSYNEHEHTIVVNTNYVGDIASVLAHEVQHAIQQIEGFASGGNPESMQERFEAAKEEWRARAWADALRDKADEMGEHYNQAAVEKALIDEYKEMGMDNDEWMPNKETRMKGFNYFARGYADRSLDADIKKFRLNESTRSDFSPYVEYTKLGGEVESRNVEHRMNMTPEERRASLAAETEDVSREDQIFLMSGDGGNANSEMPQERETEDDYSEFAKEHGVDVDMVKDYASGMKTGNLQKADIALAEIRRTMRVANRGMKLSEFGKLFRPVQKELAERYGDIETLRQEHIDAVMRERGVMEAARKRAEEEEAKRKAHLEEMSLLTIEELDKRYFDAIEIGDDAAAREILDEAARRKGYDDTESNYQGVGAWSAPSNPGYESDAERRADVEENAPDVNIEDIALGYSLVDEKYWQEPRKYMQTDATAIESVNAIREAIAAVRRGEKNVKVKVYRAVPTSVKEGKLRNGDWVTPSKGYAEIHGNNRLEGKYRIIEDEVPVSELWWDGNDSREWGFDDGRGYKYKNVENSRKLNDLVTRDDNGEIIPPSKRFDENVEDVRYREADPKTLKGEEALAALENIFSEPTSESLPKSISTLESFKEVFKHPIRTFLGELVKVKDEVFNKIIREKRSNISGAVLSTIENADFAIRDKDGSTLYIKRFKSDNSGNTYNIVAVNKHGEVEDYVSSVHIKRDGNLRNKIKNGAELLLPQERNTDGTLSRNNSTPTAKVENNPDTSQLSLQEKSMHQAAKAVANEMHLGGNVDVLTSTDGLTGRKKNAKGWYDPQTGRITIVLPNHNGRADVVNTMLHEAVGHYGLRELVGKEKMNEFLDFVFKDADKATRSQIAHNSAKYGWDMRKATEEYMASMAEDGTFKNVNKRWWHQLKLAFLKMLHKLGFAGFSGTTLSDNDLRYLLWRSWKNLAEGPARNIYQVAEDTWRQQHLKVGDFAEPKAVDAKTREQNLYYREERERKSARDEYERSVNTAKHKMNLAWVDSMSGLKLLQDAIVPNEKDLKDWENAYMAENRMSSTNLAEMETYKKSFYKDLLDAEQELLDKGTIHEQVTNYMMAKHGLERNEVLAFRDALKHDFANDKQKMSAAWKAYKNDATAQQNKTDFESGKISWDDYKANDTAIREKYAPSYKKYRSKDYSGLTELTTDDPSIKNYQDQIATLKEQLNNERDDATKKSIRIKIAKLNKEMVNEAERIAENSSSNFEKKYDTSELWNRTNAATKASLTKQYESGLLTDEVYHHTLDMFKNYIPLRGFDDVTSDEVYNYFGNAKGQFGGGIRSAKGRKSKADDPIATIGNMAESAIMQGNRNQMKQHFLKMVLNHPSDAVSVDQLYLHYDAATQEWKPVFAEFDEHDDANAVAQKVEAFNQRMETLCQQKPDEYKKASEAHDIQYKVVGKNINEHQVHVKMQGKDYVLTINGNPEAAQALNGQTNPDSTDNPFIKFFQSTNHFMAAMFTQKNPAFILSNLSRDSFYANSMVWAKESPAYAWKFNKNWGKSLYTLFGLITRQRKGTLNMNDKVDRMYQEFIENGGETGYTFLHSVDDYKNMIAKALKESRRSGWNPKSWLKFLDNLINYLGTWAENTSRFAAYRTSREMGRSIEKSIWDAKEISVNFNKKGAGAKAAGKWEDGNRLNVMQAYMSQSAKELYVFWNAGVQGLSNVSRTFGKSKGKTLAVAGLYFAIGTALPMLMAALSQGSGDDDTNYYDLPDWVRRNNLCFYTGKGWVTIPLPIELRAFYGLGELAQSVLSGNEEYTATDIATKMLEQVSQLFPVDFMEGGGSLTSFVPSYAKPIVEAYVTNKDYTGTPIYKDAEYNKNRPEWTKAYKGTNQALVWASRLLNELGGGDDVKKANVGVMDVNPAKIQHLFEGYFGGLGKFVFQTMKVASMPFNEDNRELKNVPIINSFYKTSDERTKDRAITSKFYKYNDEYQKTKELLSLYKKELQAPEYKSKFYDLMYSPEGFSATMMDSYNKQLSAVRKAMSVTDPNSDKYKELQQQQVDIQKQAVKVIEATKGVVNSEDKEMKELYNLWMQDYSNDPQKAEERSNKTIEMRKDIVKRIMDIAKQNKPQKK
uniref:LPD38 domain-containing protein n=1 Tax=Alloprevotella sp. TaxID=1872471 RepID=UPI00402A0474